MTRWWRAGALALWICVLEARAAEAQAAASEGPAPVLVAVASHQVAMAFPLPQPSLVEGALPAPPKTVVRTTRMYGTVTIDHAAHLKRRTRCAACHGPGPVRKIQFTAQTAHERCRGCHVEMAKGPTECRSCHVVPPPPVPAVLAAAPAPAPATVPAAPAPAAAPRDPPEDEPTHFSRTAKVGLSTMFGDGGGAKVGPSLELVGGGGRNIVAYTIAAPGGASRGRTQLLVSFGRWADLQPDLRGTLMVVGGVDGMYWSSSIYPVLGVRTGLEFRTGTPVVRSLVASMAVLRDLARSEKAGDERPSETTVTLTIGAGFQLFK